MPALDLARKTSWITKFVGPLLAIAFYVYPVHAHRILDIASGPGWDASVDGINWFPAYASYPNPFTEPTPNLNLDPTKIDPRVPDDGTSNAKLMWFAPPGTTPDGRSGPTKVFFKYEFDMSSATIFGDPFGISQTSALIAADDWMSVKLNGHEVGTYLLDDHKLPNRQPKPIAISLTDFLNTFPTAATDHNVILIEAHDGGVAAGDADYEWVFFDAQYQSASAASPVTFRTPGAAIPAPATALLMVSGLPLVVRSWNRRR